MTDPQPWFPLETPRLRLRPFVPEDLDDLHAYGSDPRVSRFMDWGPNSDADSREVLDRMLAEQAEWPRDNVSLAIELKEEGRLVGSIRLSVIAPEPPTAELGYTLAADCWRRGLCTEAAAAVVDVGFRSLGLYRIVATCNRRNRGSWGVMRKLGMRREGCFRRDRQVKGEWRDTYLYAIRADEWVG